MGAVVITACLPCDKVKQFEEVVITLLRGYDADISVFTHVDGSVSVMATEKPLAVPEPVTAAAAPVDEPAYTIPSPTPGIPAIEASPAEIDVAMDVNPSHVAPADPVPELPPSPTPPVFSGEVVVKDLSNVCAVPFHVDNSAEHSVLSVKELTIAADCVIFTYCGSTYKLPVAKATDPALVYNANPLFTPTSIRVIVDIVGSHHDGFPMIIQLIEGSEYWVAFGRDADILFSDAPNSNPISTEAPTSDSLPA